MSATGIVAGYDAGPVLRGLDLEVEAGMVTALLGPSGCGKTTALRVLAGLQPVESGTVRLGDRVMSAPGTHVGPEDRRVGLVFQHAALFPHLDVAANVAFGLPAGRRRGGRRADARVDEVLELVGLAGFGERSPESLSGGQAQRVALARALAPEPGVLLLDEPFANLDAVLRRRLRDEVGAIVRAAGVTAVVVTHDRDEAFALADRVAVMRDGVVAQIGPPDEVYGHPVDEWVAGVVGELAGWPADPLLRPEQLVIGPAPDVADGKAGEVVRSVFAGADVVVTVVLDAASVPVTVRVRATEDRWRVGDRVAVAPR